MHAIFNAQDPCYPVRVSIPSACVFKEDGYSAIYLDIAEANELIRSLQEAIHRAETSRRLLTSEVTS